jgi:hypothetical protein
MNLAQTSSPEDGKDSGYVGGVAISPARSPVAGAPTPNFTDKGGLVLKNVHVQLIFWGSVWGTGANQPTIDDVTKAVTSILAGPYMSMLDQYQGIGNGVLNGTTSVFTPIADNPANPPNPFSEDHVMNLVSNLIKSGTMPDPASNNQLLYCVVMPPGVNYTKKHIIGLHSFQELDGQNVHYAWITNGGTLASVTSIFSHELVEACTDPEGSAILGINGTCREDSWCEIGDVCEHQVKVVDGITLQSYWSQHEGSCVVPI